MGVLQEVSPRTHQFTTRLLLSSTKAIGSTLRTTDTSKQKSLSLSGHPPAHLVSTERAAAKHRCLVSITRFLVAALILPQLPTLIWCLQAGSFSYLRGWVNVEYLAVLSLAAVMPNWITFGLATIEMSLALIEPIAHLYYFHLSDVLSSLRYLGFLPPRRLFEYACLSLAYAAFSLLALRLLVGVKPLQWTKQMVCCLAILGLLATVADMSVGRFALYLGVRSDYKNRDVGTPRIIRMPFVSLVYSLFEFSEKSEASRRRALPLSSALSQAMAQISPANHPDVVLVLTESWGLAKDQRIVSAQMGTYQSAAISARYRVQTGQVRFDGATTAGETRELCGNSAGHASLAFAQSYFSECWPAKLNRKGYETLVVHGFTPTMFRREEWYHRFGFDKEVFEAELQDNGAAICGGAYIGICDSDVARWIGSTLLTSQQRPKFVHWVTLNSHLPVPMLDESSSEKDCVARGIEQERGLCSWFLLVQRVHEQVAKLAATPGLRPTVFVVVGDHAPPFTRPSLRDRLSQTYVPYVLLLPKSIGIWPKSAAIH